jgi:hypothetical protein
LYLVWFVAMHLCDRVRPRPGVGVVAVLEGADVLSEAGRLAVHYPKPLARGHRCRSRTAVLTLRRRPQFLPHRAGHCSTAGCPAGHDGSVGLQCLYTGAPSVWAADTVVMVTARLPNDALFKHLAARQGDWADAGLRAVTTIGDAHAPSTIASAVCSGHKLGRELDLTVDAPAVHIRREVTALSDDHPSTGPNAEVLTAAPSTGS